MYWILAIMAAIAATVIALVVGGLVTPAEYRAVRRIRLQRNAHDVHELLTDVAAYERWAPSPMSIARETSADAEVIALRVIDDDTRAQYRWEWRVSADAAGSVVAITETGRVGNPVVRFFAAWRGHGGNVERTLRALAEHFDEFGVLVERL